MSPWQIPYVQSAMISLFGDDKKRKTHPCHEGKQGEYKGIAPLILNLGT
jgi:hypothetical protein